MATATAPPTYAEFVEATSMSCGIVPYYKDKTTGEWTFGVTVRDLPNGNQCLSLALGGRDLVFTAKDGKRWHFDLRSEHHVRNDLMPFAKELGIPDSVFAPFDASVVLTREERRAQFYPMFVAALVAAGATDIRVEDTISAAANECQEELGLDAFEDIELATGTFQLDVVRRDLASWRDGGMKRIEHILYAFDVTEETAKSHALNQEGAEKGAYLTGALIRKMCLETAIHFTLQYSKGAVIDLFELANAIAALQKYLWVICPIWASRPGVKPDDLEMANLTVCLTALLEINAKLEGDTDKYDAVYMPGLIAQNVDMGMQELTQEEVVTVLRIERRRVQ